MRGAFNKDVLRSVTHSLGRFLAIAGIVALGTGFYAGLRMTAPDMKLAADQFYDGTNLMDIRVVSTLGLTDDDLAALRGVEGVAQVMGAYETDVMATVNDEQYAIRVHSLPAAAAESDTGDGVNAVSGAADYLNRPVLVEGSWPVREGECVLSADKVMNTPTKIGDTVQITEGSQDVDDVLATRTYQVVGYVHSSYYVSSTSMGTTSLGSGSVQQFMYVPESDFSKDLPYTEAFVTVAGAAGEFSGSDAYFERVHEVEDRIETLAPAREQARADGLRASAASTTPAMPPPVPPMKTTSGAGSPASASGARPCTGVIFHAPNRSRFRRMSAQASASHSTAYTRPQCAAKASSTLTLPVPAPTSQQTSPGRTASLPSAAARTSCFVIGTSPRANALSAMPGARCGARGAASASSTLSGANAPCAHCAAVACVTRSSG